MEIQGRLAYSTSTVVYDDEYTNEGRNREQLSLLGFADRIKVGVSPIRFKVHKSKYEDANWME